MLTIDTAFMTGTSSLLGGSVTAFIRQLSQSPFRLSFAVIEETNNTRPGFLDISSLFPGVIIMSIVPEIQTDDGTVYEPTVPLTAQGSIDSITPLVFREVTIPGVITLQDPATGEEVQATGPTFVSCAVGRFEFAGGATAPRIITFAVIGMPLLIIALLRRRRRRQLRRERSAIDG